MDFRYPEVAAHGGRIEYRGPIPVLHTSGDPESIGRQIGELALKPAARLLDYPYEYIKSQIPLPLLPKLIWLLLRRKCRQLYAQIPDVERREIEAISATGLDRSRLIAANTLFDMSNMGFRPLFGCSSFLVPPASSATGGTLHGRNLDFFDIGYLHAFSLAIVHRPTASAFGLVHLGFPGAVGCFSGMNQYGLAIARHEVVGPRKMRTYDHLGTPFGISLRRVLETCRTTEEAVRLLGETRHTTLSIVGLSDPHSIRIAELSPQGTYIREPSGGIDCFANHYAHPNIANPAQTNVFSTLDRQTAMQLKADTNRAGIAEVWAALHAANQGDLTLQSMIFEPAKMRIHAAFGHGPTTAISPTILDVEALLKSG